MPHTYDPNQPRVPQGRHEGGRWTRHDFGHDDPIIRPARLRVAQAAPGLQRPPAPMQRSSLPETESPPLAPTEQPPSPAPLPPPLDPTPWTPSGITALRLLALLNLLPFAPLFEDEDRQTALSFRAREYPGKRDFVFETSRDLTREQVEEICGKKIKKIQKWIDEEYEKRKDSGLSKSQLGTAVHEALKNRIKNKNDPNLSSEISFQKALDDDVVPEGETKEQYERSVKPGGKGSIRIDIELKVPEKSLICFPDIKTGEKGFSFARMSQFVDRASKVPENEDLRRIIMIEMRPKNSRTPKVKTLPQ